MFIRPNPYAIVQASGKQFWVEPNRFYDFDKLPLKKGDIFTLNNILLMNSGFSAKKEVWFGKPFLDAGFTIEAQVIRHLSGPKIRVYKMRSKKKTRKTYGSRQKLTRVFINSFSYPSDSPSTIRSYL